MSALSYMVVGCNSRRMQNGISFPDFGFFNTDGRKFRGLMWGMGDYLGCFQDHSSLFLRVGVKDWNIEDGFATASSGVVLGVDKALGPAVYKIAVDRYSTLKALQHTHSNLKLIVDNTPGSRIVTTDDLDEVVADLSGDRVVACIQSERARGVSYGVDSFAGVGGDGSHAVSRGRGSMICAKGYRVSVGLHGASSAAVVSGDGASVSAASESPLVVVPGSEASVFSSPGGNITVMGDDAVINHPGPGAFVLVEGDDAIVRVGNNAVVCAGPGSTIVTEVNGTLTTRRVNFDLEAGVFYRFEGGAFARLGEERDLCASAK